MILAAHASAEPPKLSLPIDCTLGVDCFIEDYVDADPSEGQSDYTCGLKSRDGHNGTDLVLKGFELMQQGVDVLASAPGTVAAIRDGVSDRPVTEENRHLIEGRECGNAVRIDHGEGWQTLYCHMENGSVTVNTGDVVQTGDALGKVGLSGLTNVPHVHFSVFKDGTPIDPFAPETSKSCSEEAKDGLWIDTPRYSRAGLFTAGFSTSIPTFDAVKTGGARHYLGHADAPIVLYGYAFYVEDGDEMHLSISGPEDFAFETLVRFDTHKAELFRAFGRKPPENGWPTGAYRGYVTLSRRGEILAVRHADFTVVD